MRTLPLATLLLASASLGACSTWKPPAITYDDTPRQAVLQPDPPKSVQVVEQAPSETEASSSVARCCVRISRAPLTS